MKIIDCNNIINQCQKFNFFFTSDALICKIYVQIYLISHLVVKVIKILTFFYSLIAN